MVRRQTHIELGIRPTYDFSWQATRFAGSMRARTHPRHRPLDAAHPRFVYADSPFMRHPVSPYATERPCAHTRATISLPVNSTRGVTLCFAKSCYPFRLARLSRCWRHRLLTPKRPRNSPQDSHRCGEHSAHSESGTGQRKLRGSRNHSTDQNLRTA